MVDLPCVWCDAEAVLRAPRDHDLQECDAACKAHVPDLCEAYDPLSLIPTPHGRATLNMVDLVAWGVADDRPRPGESRLEARLRANREVSTRTD